MAIRFNTVTDNKRVTLFVVLMILLAGGFWLGSRVPSLNEKALMGGDANVDAIGFDTIISVQLDDPVVLRIAYTTVNWISTNIEGMSFGILFAALMLSLLPLLTNKSFESAFANTALGIAIGAPLGVCVNCVAPIAQGLHKAGARVETTLATMFSSPTMNVIVLAMTFSLFPFYVGAIKVGLTLLFILVGIPLLTRFFPIKEEVFLTEQQMDDLNKGSSQPAFVMLGSEMTADESWRQASIWIRRSYWRSLLYILRTAVPLMLLAGLLGSIIITLLPWDSLVDILPSTGVALTLIGMGLLAILGIFLPVPIAFDVIIVAILSAAGLPIKYALVLLFTLGIYSIYSFFIVWKSISKVSAVVLFVVLVGLGVVAGVAGLKGDEWYTARRNQLFFENQVNIQDPTVYRVESNLNKVNEQELLTSLQFEALTPISFQAQTPDSITISTLSFQPGDIYTGAFTRLEGSSMGINIPYGFSVYDNVAPFSHSRGISSGDVHNDGWVDLLITTVDGIQLFANQGGKGFAFQEIHAPTLDGLILISAALVDMNNDGWLDIFAISYRGGNYLIYNNAGSFSQENIQLIPNFENAILSAAVTFGDVDRDGDLDIALGNWSLGIFAHTKSSPETSRNAWLRNNDGQYELNPLEGIVGETLTTLFSDFNNDGFLDLMIGNDFNPADVFYLGDGTGDFQMLSKSDAVIPMSARASMGFDVADINNDLMLDIYSVGISYGKDVGNPISAAELCDEITNRESRQHCMDIENLQRELRRSIQTQDPFTCFSTIVDEYQLDCLAYHILFSATRWNPNLELCALFPDSWERFEFICRLSFDDMVEVNSDRQGEEISQQRNFNVLLMQSGDGIFIDDAVSMGVGVGGWSWNSKFADLNNDEWQDLYIANGQVTTNSRESNYFYLNNQGFNFEDKTEEFGLTSHFPTSSYTYIDIDNDGDLDIVTIPTNSEVIVFINNAAQGNPIAFSLRDFVGNHYGIGTKIIIHYGSNGERVQVRELKAGGGFMSFDAPIAYFGLGEYEQVDYIEVLWSTGETSVITGDIASGSMYIITRSQ